MHDGQRRFPSPCGSCLPNTLVHVAWMLGLKPLKVKLLAGEQKATENGSKPHRDSPANGGFLGVPCEASALKAATMHLLCRCVLSDQGCRFGDKEQVIRRCFLFSSANRHRKRECLLAWGQQVIGLLAKLDRKRDPLVALGLRLTRPEEDLWLMLGSIGVLFM